MGYILNAFSLNMLAEAHGVSVNVQEISIEEAKKYASKMESAVGHADTAAVFSTVLGTPVAFNRTTVSLKVGETALVGQYRGPRLPEGATTLPDGATIQWLIISISVN